MELNIKTHAAIGDIFFSKQLLDEVKDNYDIININFDKDILRQYKGDYDLFYDFTSKMFKELFSEKPYCIGETSLSKTYAPMEICNMINSKFKVPNFQKYFCNEFNNTQEDYIVVLTKIRGWDYGYYLEVKEEYLKLLNKISHKTKIYIMGERTIGANLENQIHGPQIIYSIYDDLSENIDNFQDLTVEEFGIFAPKYEDFLNDCQIMNNSKHVICLGVSGSINMAMSVSKVINYYGNSIIENIFNSFPKENEKFFTNDLNQFFAKLESLT